MKGHVFTERDLSRFWAKVDTSGGCWLWEAATQNRGYGQFSVGTRLTQKQLLAHRVSYELLVAPIPDGLTIDHLCLVKRCVNPEHMEVVTRAENTRRGHVKSECIRGHDLAVTRRFLPSNRPYCHECQNVRNKARYQNVA